MRAATPEIGQFMPFDLVPNGGDLVLLVKQRRADVARALAIPVDSFSAALVNTKGEKFETVWLCQAVNPVDLQAAYCLVRHNHETV
jgi:hypothetical protein